MLKSRIIDKTMTYIIHHFFQKSRKLDSSSGLNINKNALN